jgi:hypothetical protein
MAPFDQRDQRSRYLLALVTGAIGGMAGSATALRASLLARPVFYRVPRFKVARAMPVA